jgi:hypothetical protein
MIYAHGNILVAHEIYIGLGYFIVSWQCNYIMPYETLEPIQEFTIKAYISYMRIQKVE